MKQEKVKEEQVTGISYLILIILATLIIIALVKLPILWLVVCLLLFML